MPEAAFDHRALVPQPFLRTAQFQRQRLQVGAAKVLQFDPLQMLEDALLRIQLRGIARQSLHMNPPLLLAQKRPNVLSSMRRESGPRPPTGALQHDAARGAENALPPGLG